ncbi:MAG TPA: CpsB/CapC family capsule biosynthesis tyrosine phosphatase [Phycisphaerae bacterium]|nr:CpsB/CapC family capsule biosynthesis tyrosine phosphatase [Phycisphaerae bacterium]
MNRIDVHCHFLPDQDDGCEDLGESLECLRTMAAHGYNRVFCTPHCGSSDFTELTCEGVAERVRELQGHVTEAGIPIELRAGGELRLSPHLAEDLPRMGVPTYGHGGKYVLADLWEADWPVWATRGVEWLQKRGLTVIIAHPERMPVMRGNPGFIAELAKLGVLFQGNLGPIAGADSAGIVALAQRFLQDGRYFMVGTDGHRANHMEARLAGLKRVEELVGKEKLEELTVRNPGRLWAVAPPPTTT